MKNETNMDETQKAQFEQMQRDIDILKQYKDDREHNQIQEPLDDASKAALGAILDGGGANIVATRNITIGSTPATISVPVNPTGFRAIDVGGSQFYIATYTP